MNNILGLLNLPQCLQRIAADVPDLLCGMPSQISTVGPTTIAYTKRGDNISFPAQCIHVVCVSSHYSDSCTLW